MAYAEVAKKLSRYPQPLHDHVIFTTDNVYEEMLSTHIYSNTAIINEAELDASRHIHRKIHGTVIGIPKGLTRTKIGEEHEGAPVPKRNYSHDQVMKLENMGFSHNGRKDNWCTPHEPKGIYLSDLTSKMDLQIGDKIYFEYNTLEEENELGWFEGKKVFKVRYDNVICAVRKWTDEEIKSLVPWTKQAMEAKYPQRKFLNQEIYDHIKSESSNTIMQAGWVLITPEMESWEDFMTESGIVVKSSLDPKPLRGFVAFISNSDYGIKKGDNIAFAADSEWVNVIEGSKYFVMQEKYILGTFHNNKG